MTRISSLSGLLQRWCPACRAVRSFERPGCDDHGRLCREIVCCSCSAGLER